MIEPIPPTSALRGSRRSGGRPRPLVIDVLESRQLLAGRLGDFLPTQQPFGNHAVFAVTSNAPGNSTVFGPTSPSLHFVIRRVTDGQPISIDHPFRLDVVLVRTGQAIKSHVGAKDSRTEFDIDIPDFPAGLSEVRFRFVRTDTGQINSNMPLGALFFDPTDPTASLPDTTVDRNTGIAFSASDAGANQSGLRSVVLTDSLRPNFRLSPSITLGAASFSGSYDFGGIQGSRLITVTSTDDSGRTSVASRTYDFDTTAPDPATSIALAPGSDTGTDQADNVTSDFTPTFLVRGVQGGSTVELLRGTSATDPNPRVVATVSNAVVATDGTFSITDATVAPVGTTQFYSVRQTDRAGNVGRVGPGTPLAVTFVASPAPPAPVLRDDSNSGSKADALTNDTSPAFDIPTEAGARYDLLRNGAVVATLNVPSNAQSGTRAIADPGPVPQGDQTYTLRKTDAAGNITTSLDSLVVTIDTTAPAVAGTPDLDDASDTGSSNRDDLTRETSPTFQVAGIENGGTVVLLRDGVEVARLDDNPAGTVAIRDPGPVPDGIRRYTAVHIDRAGNAADASGPLIVTVGTVPPAATSSPDLQAGSDSGRGDSDDLTNVTSPAFDVSGILAGATLELFRDGVLVRTLANLPGGSAAISDLGPAPEGDRVYRVRQTDRAGNVGPLSGPLTVRFDRTAPTVADVVDVAPDPRNVPVGSVLVVFSEPIDLATFGAGDVELLRDGVLLATPAGLTIEEEPGSTATYRISGLDLATAPEGEYLLRVLPQQILDPAGNAASAGGSDTWVMDTTPPRVVDVADVTPDPRNVPVDSVLVRLSEPIRPSTFTVADLRLTRDGGLNLIATGSGVTVTRVDDTTYRVDGLRALTSPEGTYVLTVDATGLTDRASNDGTGSASDQWVMDTTPPVLLGLAAIAPDPRNTPLASLDATFSEPIDLATFGGDDLTLTYNGGPNLIDSGVTVALVTGTTATYRISGLGRLTAADGVYRIGASGEAVSDPATNVGRGTASRTWALDTTPPRLVGLAIAGPAARTTPVASATLSLSEAVTTPPALTDVTLSRNGSLNLIGAGGSGVRISAVGPGRFVIDGLAALTAEQGIYRLSVRVPTDDAPTDAAGNPISGSPVTTTWVLDTTAPAFRGVPDRPLVVRATGPSGARVSYPALAAVDNLGSSPAMSASIPSGSLFPVGSTRVELSARDDVGNVGRAGFVVTVLPFDPTPPRVESVRAISLGNRVDRVLMTFSEGLDPASIATGQVVARLPGRDGRRGTRDDVRSPFRAGSYDAATRTLTLVPTARLAARRRFRIELTSGPKDAAGNALDGDGDGRAGGAFIRDLRPAPLTPIRRRRR